jgi:hypothetical protein
MIMNDTRIRIRANRSTGELEVAGSSQAVAEWWNKLWPELGDSFSPSVTAAAPSRLLQSPLPTGANGQFPEVFGEFYSEFRPDITDVDKVLIAGAFVQSKEPDRIFSTKTANQLLLDQNIKVANASVNVRRLIQTKRAFVVSDGKYRVSASGFEYLKSLKAV